MLLLEPLLEPKKFGMLTGRVGNFMSGLATSEDFSTPLSIAEGLYLGSLTTTSACLGLDIRILDPDPDSLLSAAEMVTDGLGGGDFSFGTTTTAGGLCAAGSATFSSTAASGKVSGK